MLILICGTDSKDVPISVGRPRAFYNLKNCYLDHRYFCELGGMYKLWKQVNTDIVGLEHYRRFFTDNNAVPGTLLNEHQIKDILSSHDIIMSPNHLYAQNVMTWMAQEKHNPNASTDTIVKEMLFKWFMYLRDNYSAELVDYTFNRMLTTRSYYGCNMFIGNKRVTDEYAQFLFPDFFKDFPPFEFFVQAYPMDIHNGLCRHPENRGHLIRKNIPDRIRPVEQVRFGYLAIVCGDIVYEIEFQPHLERRRHTD